MLYLILIFILGSSLLHGMAEQSIQETPANIRAVAEQAIAHKNYDAYFRYMENLELAARQTAVNQVIANDNITILHATAKNCTYDVLTKLLSYRANIHARTLQAGETPLHVAALYNNIQAIECLLDHQADVNAAANPSFCTPLHVAAMNGSCEALQCLARREGNLETEICFRYTPFHCAVTHGQTAAIFCLYKLGANLTKETTRYNLTPLELAASYGQEKSYSCLMAIYELEKIAKDTSLDATNRFSISLSNAGLADTLINLFNLQNVTVLMRASSEGFWFVVDELLKDKRTDVRVRGLRGNTALHFAAENGHEKVVAILCSVIPPGQSIVH